MKDNTLRLLMLSAAFLFLFAPAPAYALNEKGVQTGDTISITCALDNSTIEGYLLAANDSKNVYSTKNMSMDVLWEVVRLSGDGNQFRLKCLGVTGNDRYLRFSEVSGREFYEAALASENNATAFFFNNGDLSQVSAGVWQSKLQFKNGTTTNYAYPSANSWPYNNTFKWYADGNNANIVNIEQWKQKKETNLDITCSGGFSLEFPFVDDKDNRLAEEQK